MDDGWLDRRLRDAASRPARHLPGTRPKLHELPGSPFLRLVNGSKIVRSFKLPNFPDVTGFRAEKVQAIVQHMLPRFGEANDRAGRFIPGPPCRTAFAMSASPYPAQLFPERRRMARRPWSSLRAPPGSLPLHPSRSTPAHRRGARSVARAVGREFFAAMLAIGGHVAWN